MSGFAIPQFFFPGGAGGSLYVYQTGTTTPVTLYADGALTTPITNPIVLDSNGGASFYTSGTVNLKLSAYTAAGGLIETLDPVYPVGTAEGFTTESTLASSGTTDLGTATSNIINITGTTTITSFGSSASINNPLYFLRFTGALTLTYNATSLVLPGQTNIVTVVGDTAVAQYLGSGNWKVLSYSPINVSLIGGVIKTIKRQVFTSTGTYTPNANLIYCDISVWGAGGGGGGVSGSSNRIGAGGGGGGYSAKSFAAATIGASKAVTIGAGGTAGANTGGTGGTGGTTSVGATLLQATGGVGGIGGTTAGTSTAGGAGGVGSIGDDNRTGQNGFPGMAISGAATQISGAGGIAPGMGGQGTPVGSLTGESNGVNATANSGSGGSGAASAGNAFTGGVGDSGYCVITEYCSA